MNSLTLGVVGLGWAGRQAVMAALAVPRTELIAVCDIEAGLRDSVVEEFSLPRGPFKRPLLLLLT